MSSLRRRKEEDNLENSILAKLGEEYKAISEQEEFSNEITVLFCGTKRSGQTSLVDRLIHPAKDATDIPKPTVALDYKFARYSADSQSSNKVLAHIYDLGGDSTNENLVAIPVSVKTVGNLVLALTVDLSAPHAVLDPLLHWLKILREQVSKAVEELRKSGTSGANRVSEMEKEATSEEKDKDKVKPFPVPLVIFATRFDVFAEENATDDKRKVMCRALRYCAHVNGATLMCTSLKEKTAMNNMRLLLRQLLFGVPAKGLAEQTDPSKPVVMMAGKDTFESIGAPSGGNTEKAWRDLVATTFPDLESNSKGKSEAEEVTDELQKFPESAIDGMVEQRTEELQQYRKQVERNQRLASEGVNVDKLGALTT